MDSSPFFLAPPAKAENLVTYKIHPLVVFNILDHYRRRERDQKRVVGTLFGEISNGTEGKIVHVKDCFPIPHSESEDRVEIDFNYHKSIANVQKRLNAKEDIVGWYSTGTEITYLSSLIHEEFVRKYKQSPLHLLVDATLTGNTLSVEGYIGRALSAESNKEAVIAQFEKVKTELANTDAAKIAIDAMIHGTPDERKKIDSPLTMQNEVENLHDSLLNLLDLLEKVSGYVDKVNSGDKKSTDEVGGKIKDALAAIPRMEPEIFTSMFNQKTEDLLMILYLANITRAQVALGNRIYEVLE